MAAFNRLERLDRLVALDGVPAAAAALAGLVFYAAGRLFVAVAGVGAALSVLSLVPRRDRTKVATAARGALLSSLFALTALLGGACAAQQPVAASPTAVPAGGAPAALAAETSVTQVPALIEAGAFVLDVREQGEWAAGHIAGATLIPLGQLAARISEVPRDHQIVVVCHSGNRSAQGRDLLRQAGYPAVTSMAGGMADWVAAGLPLVTGS
jgi:rhodanese-related sulfurtransferase